MNLSSSLMSNMGISLGGIEIATDYLTNPELYESEIAEIKASVSNKPQQPVQKVVKPVQPIIKKENIINKFSLVHPTKNFITDETLDSGTVVHVVADFDFDFTDTPKSKQELMDEIESSDVEELTASLDLMSRLQEANVLQSLNEEDNIDIDIEDEENEDSTMGIVEEDIDIDTEDDEDNMDEIDIEIEDEDEVDIEVEDEDEIDIEEEDEIDIEVEDEDEVDIDIEEYTDTSNIPNNQTLNTDNQISKKELKDDIDIEDEDDNTDEIEIEIDDEDAIEDKDEIDDEDEIEIDLDDEEDEPKKTIITNSIHQETNTSKLNAINSSATKEQKSTEQKDIESLKAQLADLQKQVHQSNNGSTQQTALKQNESVSKNKEIDSLDALIESGKHKTNRQVIGSKYDKYTVMKDEELYKYVKAFLIKHGVKQKPVDIEIVNNEFGALNIQKLIKKCHLIKTGKGVTVGI